MTTFHDWCEINGFCHVTNGAEGSSVKVTTIDNTRFNEIVETAKRESASEIERLTAELDEWKKHAAQSDEELCQLQDALGCPAESRNYHCDCGWRGINRSDCPKCGKETHDDGMVCSQELSMERIRDLIAREGELGDLTARVAELEAASQEKVRCEFCDGTGVVSYNPNLNPNIFPAVATAKCSHCSAQLENGRTNG